MSSTIERMDALAGKGITPSMTKQLYLSCEKGELSKVTQHLENGISVDAPLDDVGNTPLSVAAAHAQDELVRHLLKRGAALESSNAYGWTALMHAARNGHAHVVNTLVSNKADVRVSSHVGASALHCGVCSADVATVRALIEAGLDVTSSSSRPRGAAANSSPTPLSLAASLGHGGVVKLLLDRGADADRCHDATNLTPLMLAAMNGHFDAVRVLVDFGANPNLRDILGNTALEYSTMRGHPEVEAYLRDRTSFVRVLTGSGSGLGGEPWRVKADMIEAARQGDVARIQELLREDPRQANTCSPQDGATPLIYASMIGRLDIVEALVSANARLNVQDKVTGWTALMQATFKGHKDVVKYLIGAGADADVKAKNGATAFTLATTIDDADTEMVRLVASKQSLSAVGRGLDGRGGAASICAKTVSWNSSSIAWVTPAKIMAKAKNVESRELTMTNEQSERETDLIGQCEVIHSSNEAQAEAYFNHEAKNGSLKHWWNRMSNRFRNLKLGRTFRLAPMPPPTNGALHGFDVDPISTFIDKGDDDGRTTPSFARSCLLNVSGESTVGPHHDTLSPELTFSSLRLVDPHSARRNTELHDNLKSSIDVNPNASFGATGNASLRSLSSGYESLVLENSGKPRLTLESSSEIALSGHLSRQPQHHHPKLQDDELLKPVVPPFHLPPGFDSPADDIFSRPFSSSTQPFSSSSSPTKNVSDSASGTGSVVASALDGVGSRVLSGTATSPMPPGRTSRPVAKLFASHQTYAKKHSSPSSKDGVGTPSPHSSGGASSVSALLKLPHSSQVKSGSGQNSSLLMSSGDSSTLTAGSDPKHGSNAVGSSADLTTGSSTISGTGSGSLASSVSLPRGSGCMEERSGGGIGTGLSFLHGSRVAGTSPGSATSSASSASILRRLSPTALPSLPSLSSHRPSTRSHDSRDSGTLTPTPSQREGRGSAVRPLTVTSVRTMEYDDDGDDDHFNDLIDRGTKEDAVEIGRQDDLAKLLTQLSLERYQPIFEEQEVDIEAFMTLNNEDLKELGIEASAARDQILSAINRLNDSGLKNG